MVFVIMASSAILGVSLVFAGRLSRHEGVFEVLEAFKRLTMERDESILDTVGRGPDEEPLRDRVDELGLTGRVHMHVSVPHAETLDAIGQADALVLPSHAEGLPKVLWEAWAHGVAVITSRVGAIPLHVRQDENGLLIDPGDVAGLSRAMARLADSASLRRTLGNAGRERAAEHTWGAEIHRIADTLYGLVKAGHSAYPSKPVDP